jgi:hypothetical protein
MMFKAKRETVGKTARFGNLFGRQRPARHRHAKILPRLCRRVGGEGQFDLWIVRNGARGAGQHLFELFEGGIVCHVRLRLNGEGFGTKSTFLLAANPRLFAAIDKQFIRLIGQQVLAPLRFIDADFVQQRAIA